MPYSLPASGKCSASRGLRCRVVAGRLLARPLCPARWRRGVWRCPFVVLLRASRWISLPCCLSKACHRARLSCVLPFSGAVGWQATGRRGCHTSASRAAELVDPESWESSPSTRRLQRLPQEPAASSATTPQSLTGYAPASVVFQNHCCRPSRSTRTFPSRISWGLLRKTMHIQPIAKAGQLERRRCGFR